MRSEWNTLQNIGQSDGAWVLLGTTIRLAQALGLHTENGRHHTSAVGANGKALWYVHAVLVWVLEEAHDLARVKVHATHTERIPGP